MNTDSCFLGKSVHDQTRIGVHDETRITVHGKAIMGVHDGQEYPVHDTLLSNDILIVENLELNKVSPGRAKFFVMPLNIPQMDGLPARVIMSR